MLSRRALFSLLLVGASAPIAVQVPLEYDVKPMADRGPISLPSIQFDNTSSDIDRKFAVSNEIHSQQRGPGWIAGHADGCNPNVES